MPKIDATTVYKKTKKNVTKYKEKECCISALEHFSNQGTIASFCEKHLISDQTYRHWLNKHEIFRECVHIGRACAKAAWEREGENNKTNAEFNYDYWRFVGQIHYRVGNNPSVALNIDPHANPYEQYKQLIAQANEGDFTSSEFKQLMESINIGIRSYETFVLEEEVLRMKYAIDKMERHNDVEGVTTFKPTMEAH